MKRLPTLSLVVVIGLVTIEGRVSFAQGPRPESQPVDITLKGSYGAVTADAQTVAIVAAADTFIASLNDTQRSAALFPFSDNAQRSNWSNLPDGIVQRRGVMLGDLSTTQRAALDALLAKVMSNAGMRNIAYQLAAEDSLGGGGGGRPNFGSKFFYTAFLGEPSTTQPWMFQFGGHHLAVNVTVFGPEASYSPMLTGGQPLHVSYEGEDVFITQRETAAAQAFMDSLTDTQRAVAVRGSRAINLLLGPGKYGTVVAPEGIRASDLTAAQKKLLFEVIVARLGFINDDDYATTMKAVDAEIDDTYFGWWGPLGAPGTAYFRVTGPSLVLEYAPQGLGGDVTDHAHNMYRDPKNDYGSAWISVRR